MLGFTSHHLSIWAHPTAKNAHPVLCQHLNCGNSPTAKGTFLLSVALITYSYNSTLPFDSVSEMNSLQSPNLVFPSDWENGVAHGVLLTGIQPWGVRGGEQGERPANLEEYKAESYDPYVWTSGFVGLFKLWMTEFQMEWSQSEKQMSCIKSCMWNLEKWYRWTYLPGRNWDADNGHADARGRGWGAAGWTGRLRVRYVLCHVWHRQLVGSTAECRELVTQRDGAGAGGSSRRKGCMYTRSWLTSSFSRNQYNVVKWPHPS